MESLRGAKCTLSQVIEKNTRYNNLVLEYLIPEVTIYMMMVLSTRVLEYVQYVHVYVHVYHGTLSRTSSYELVYYTGQRRVVELSFGSPPPEMAVLQYSYSEDTYSVLVRVHV